MGDRSGHGLGDRLGSGAIVGVAATDHLADQLRFAAALADPLEARTHQPLGALDAVAAAAVHSGNRRPHSRVSRRSSSV